MITSQEDLLLGSNTIGASGYRMVPQERSFLDGSVTIPQINEFGNWH
jgi:hypothetical protein